ASLESSYANLFGVGHNLTLRGNVSLKNQKIESIYYTPWFFGLPVQFNGTLYLNRHSDSTTYYGVFRGLKLALGRSTSYNMLYQAWFNWEGGSFQYLRDTIGVASPEIPVKSFGVGLTYDTRNDFLNPETGIYNLFQAEVSGLIPNSSKFIKFTDDFRFLWKMRSLSFGTGLKLGWIRPYGGTTGLQAQELFYAGGARSVRGFKENLLRSDTSGGSFMATANILEVRFPLFWWFHGAVFADCGYVWNTTIDKSEKISFNDIRWTAGPGLRLNTPIAVVRLDMGFKLDRRAGEGLFEFHFDLGQVF
ncbi:MAG: outer membrane protein assembly factor, partial [Fibrobacter sp.]|nr:outer membrane protein assembly factor [Fibrobacter sp.]